MYTTETITQSQWQTHFLQLISCLQQELAGQFETGETTSARVGGAGKEVVIELTAGGFVYVLTRCPSAPACEQVSLSQREQEIVRLVCGGLPNKAISDVLEISPWTVATYLKRIFAKLAVGSRAEMVARVLQEGLLDEEEHRH